jgi:hypothetical protein
MMEKASFKSVQVQYDIRTTSDWTVFQITEGGYWSDIKIECLEGKDKLAGDIVHSDKRIEIRKNPMDRSLVDVKVTCKLNIYEDYLSSEIRYLIEKGDIESTLVRLLFKGREVYRLSNHGVSHSPRNPQSSAVPVAEHPPTESLSRRLLTLFKVAGLIVSGYLGILIASLVYSYGLALDFFDLARSNPYVFIVGGAILSGTLVAVGLKRNWI